MTYREVVRVPHVRRLLVGTLIGRLPNGMCALAVALVLREAGIGFGFIGIVVGAYLTAAAAAGPLLGRLVDGYGPAWVMPPTALCGAVALTVLAAWPGRPAVALAAALAAGMANPPLEPALRALWPRLVPPRLLRHAYGVDASSQTLIFVVGPVLVSAAAGWVAPPAAVLLAVVLMLAGTALVVSSPAVRPARSGRRWIGGGGQDRADRGGGEDRRQGGVTQHGGAGRNGGDGGGAGQDGGDGGDGRAGRNGGGAGQDGGDGGGGQDGDAAWPGSAGTGRGRLWALPYGVLVVGLAGAGGSVGAFNVFAVDYTAQCALLAGIGLDRLGLGGAGSAGSLPAVAAFAGLLVGLVVGGLRWRRRRVRVLSALLALGSAALIVAPACSALVYLASALTGMFLPPLLGSAFALVNQLVPAGRSAEALAWLTTLFLAGSALATVLSGAAVEAAGPTGAAVVGTTMAAAGALVCLALRSVDT